MSHYNRQQDTDFLDQVNKMREEEEGERKREERRKHEQEEQQRRLLDQHLADRAEIERLRAAEDRVAYEKNEMSRLLENEKKQLEHLYAERARMVEEKNQHSQAMEAQRREAEQLRMEKARAEEASREKDRQLARNEKEMEMLREQQRNQEPQPSGPHIRFTNRCSHSLVIQRHPDPNGLIPYVDRMLQDTRKRGNWFAYANNEGLAVLQPGQDYTFKTENCDQYITVYWLPAVGQSLVNACKAFRVPIRCAAYIDSNHCVHLE